MLRLLKAITVVLLVAAFFCSAVVIYHVIIYYIGKEPYSHYNSLLAAFVLGAVLCRSRIIKKAAQIEELNNKNEHKDIID